MNVKITKFISHGFIAVKFENLNDLSLDAQGILVTMVNNPNYDYVTAEELYSSHSDSKEVFDTAIAELLQKNYLFKDNISQKLAVNKAKMINTMFWVEPNM
ncbi:MAG: hypothetical protein ACI4I6_02415 [Hominimerdicola sp.]